MAKKYQRLAALAFFIFLLGCVASPGGLGTPPASAVLVAGTPPAAAAQASDPLQTTEATASVPLLHLYVSPAVPPVLSDSLQLPGDVVTVEQRQQADFSFEAITPQNAAGAVAYPIGCMPWWRPSPLCWMAFRWKNWSRPGKGNRRRTWKVEFCA